LSEATISYGRPEQKGNNYIFITMKCPNCGSEDNKPYRKRCIICGAPLVPVSSAPEPTIVTVETPPEPAAVTVETPEPAAVTGKTPPEPAAVKGSAPSEAANGSSMPTHDSSQAVGEQKNTPCDNSGHLTPSPGMTASPSDSHTASETSVAAAPPATPTIRGRKNVSEESAKPDVPYNGGNDNGYDEAPIESDDPNPRREHGGSALSIVIIIAAAIASIIGGALLYSAVFS